MAVGLGVHVAEGEFDCEAHGAASTPAFVVLGVVGTIGSALEFA